MGVRRAAMVTVIPGHERSRPVVNAEAHTWKACWGQPLRSSNLLSSATLTRETPIGSAGRLAFRRSLFSVLSVEHRLHRDSPQLFCQVTGVADGLEQRAARRRACALPFKAAGIVRDPGAGCPVGVRWSLAVRRLRRAWLAAGHAD